MFNKSWDFWIFFPTFGFSNHANRERRGLQNPDFHGFLMKFKSSIYWKGVKISENFQKSQKCSQTLGEHFGTMWGSFGGVSGKLEHRTFGKNSTQGDFGIFENVGGCIFKSRGFRIWRSTPSREQGSTSRGCRKKTALVISKSFHPKLYPDP